MDGSIIKESGLRIPLELMKHSESLEEAKSSWFWQFDNPVKFVLIEYLNDEAPKFVCTLQFLSKIVGKRIEEDARFFGMSKAFPKSLPSTE